MVAPTWAIAVEDAGRKADAATKELIMLYFTLKRTVN